jgi:hypothetical protein
VTDKDSGMLFEAYRKIYEAPVDPGGSWGDEEGVVVSQFDKGELDRLAKYKIPDKEMVAKIINAMKAFLLKHENSHFPGTYKEFREALVQEVARVAGIGGANAGYATRVVANALKRLNVLSVDGATQAVAVGDMPEPNTQKEKQLDKELADGIQDIVELQLRLTYQIGPDSGATPESEADKGFELLQQEIGSGRTATGKEIINILKDHGKTADGKRLGYDAAKIITAELMKTDAIFIPDEEEDEFETGPSDADLQKIDKYAGGDYDRDDGRHDAGDVAKELGFGQELGGGSMGDDDYY